MGVTFYEPESLAEVLEALAQHGEEAKVLAGGTALVLMMQQKLLAAARLLSLGRVPGLEGIRAGEDGRLHIGAMTRLRDVARSPLVQQAAPALAAACGQVGNVRIQNQATLGGNLAHADYASDPPAVLLALEAVVEVAGAGGRRQIPLAHFFRGFYETALQPGEVITEVGVPAPDPGARMAYLKFTSRSSEDRPCVAVAAVASFAGTPCTALRLAVGAACETPQRLPSLEALAAGQPLSDELIEEIAAGYAGTLQTLDDLRGSAWYRSQIVRVQVRRALQEVRRAPQEARRTPQEVRRTPQEARRAPEGEAP